MFAIQIVLSRHMKEKIAKLYLKNIFLFKWINYKQEEESVLCVQFYQMMVPAITPKHTAAKWL